MPHHLGARYLNAEVAIIGVLASPDCPCRTICSKPSSHVGKFVLCVLLFLFRLCCLALLFELSVPNLGGLMDARLWRYIDGSVIPFTCAAHITVLFGR